MVECGGLENRLARNPGHGGSNPPSSASLTVYRHGKPCLFCFVAATKGDSNRRGRFAPGKQPSGLFSANREEALADEVKRAQRDSESPSSASLNAYRHGSPCLFFFYKPVLMNGLFRMRHPDAARHSGRHLAFQSSLAYRSTLRFSFKAICSPGMPLAVLRADGLLDMCMKKASAETDAFLFGYATTT